MKKSELKAEKISGGGMTTKILFLAPEQPNSSWIFYPDRKLYGKAVTNNDDAILAKNEVLTICVDR